MWAVNADRHRSDVEWRTCEPGPGQSKTAERGQNALRLWMIHKSECWAGEGSMRESRGKRRSHASARNAAGSWYANSSARSLRPLFPTTQYYRIFLATVSAQRSLRNGTTRSGREVAAYPSTANSLTVTLLDKKFVTFMQPDSPIRCSQKSAIRSYPEPVESTPCFSNINPNNILPYVTLWTVEFSDDLGNGLQWAIQPQRC